MTGSIIHYREAKESPFRDEDDGTRAWETFCPCFFPSRSADFALVAFLQSDGRSAAALPFTHMPFLFLTATFSSSSQREMPPSYCAPPWRQTTPRPFRSSCSEMSSSCSPESAQEVSKGRKYQELRNNLGTSKKECKRTRFRLFVLDQAYHSSILIFR